MNNTFDPKQFAVSLTEALKAERLDLRRLLHAGLPVEEKQIRPGVLPPSFDRSTVGVSDGEKACRWKVDSLQSLFRGDKPAPSFGNYPDPSYDACFYVLELHAVIVSDTIGDRRDEEMLEIYSYLRRRTDGRSQGFVHDYMWQAAALLLGTRPLSQAEFEAIMSRLERSCRTFRMGPSSRNYIPAIRPIFND